MPGRVRGGTEIFGPAEVMKIFAGSGLQRAIADVDIVLPQVRGRLDQSLPAVPEIRTGPHLVGLSTAQGPGPGGASIRSASARSPPAASTWTTGHSIGVTPAKAHQLAEGDGFDRSKSRVGCAAEPLPQVRALLQHPFEECLGSFLAGIGQHFTGVAAFHRDAAVHEQHLVGDLAGEA
ncbi:hypothetical protein ACIRDU_36920, partial [Streptomyces sp. NPDC093598]